jgi:hypothetical protein
MCARCGQVGVLDPFDFENWVTFIGRLRSLLQNRLHGSPNNKNAAFAALTATTLLLLGSAVGYGLIAVVPVVFWSRIALARHRVHELLIGLVLGVLTGIVLVRI